ncbi:acyl-CoA dehydrogenase family protein [Nonomuraea angiospora]|uniref:acyl-CoA dehydrogenase family protein n=1 Tax=Nonomuraea angiospora TaxID=46172 RepID=UPI0029CA8B03|nr:acyl-CoA dehydrogenase family protein [Nonomuraea angiospora]
MHSQFTDRRKHALDTAAVIARTTIASHADQVDKDAVFPEASISALTQTGLFKAALPEHLGGLGLDTPAMAEIGRTLGRACGSTAMIWAMHQVQVACVARHLGPEGGSAAKLLASIVGGGGLVASVTTELGVGGNLRESRASCVVRGDRVRLTKDAPTVSYALMADAFLITARRNPGAAPGDQVLVLATKDQTELQNVGEWNVMGMRGTRSPGCRIVVDVAADQVITTPFAEVAARTMVPLSHILWSSVWIGIAEEAADRAIRRLRHTRRNGKQDAGADARLAFIGERLDALDGLLRLVMHNYETEAGQPTTDLSIQVNNLKLAASTETVKIAETALEICGMPGYQEHSESSVARMLRDLYSARLMISNSRLLETNSTAMLMRRYG